jgi:hypothetical protein
LLYLLYYSRQEFTREKKTSQRAQVIYSLFYSIAYQLGIWTLKPDYLALSTCSASQQLWAQELTVLCPGIQTSTIPSRVVTSFTDDVELTHVQS